MCLCSPPLVCESGIVFQRSLSLDVCSQLLKGGWFDASLPEPLMPLRGDLYI